ncbi:MAG: hypothetical protein IT158_30115 [Bryobacterales bacterium]|nr:hypothetical protein [Bryobacterales bacterium]
MHAGLQNELSEAERQLLIELLERERADLPAEIHHTRTPEVKDRLHRRRELVDNLLARLGATVEA